MHFLFDNSGSADKFQSMLNSISAHEDVKSICVFSCDDNEWTDEKISPLLLNCDKPVFGGIFPQIIHESENYSKGTLVLGLPYSATVKTVHGLSDCNIDYTDVIDEQFSDIKDFKTMFVFVDGLSTRIASLVESIFQVFGIESNYIGGGAGSLSFVQKPCVISNQGLLQNVAVLATLDKKSSISVGHGWKSIDKNHQLTKVDKNVILELDYQNAFTVYQQIIQKHAQQTIQSENFFSIAKAYPFGINTLDGEKIVRDPISVQENGGLTCVGELTQNDYVDILSASKEDLINAAEKTASEAALNASDLDSEITFFIDCISRTLFLEDDFKKEIDVVINKAGLNNQFAGAMVLGEIANMGDNYLEFYNKTSVVAIV